MDRLMWEQIEEYLTHLETEQSASPNTIAAYRNDLTQLYQYLISTPGREGESARAEEPAAFAQSWSSISRPRIVGFVVALKEKGYASTTVARKIAAIKSFFHYLHAQGFVETDPTETLDTPRIDKTLPRSLSHTEVLGLLAHAAHRTSPEDVRDNAMLRLLYATGLRVSELVALNLDDVDLSSGYVRCVSRSGRERLIPLDPETVRAQEEYILTARNTLIRRTEERALFVNHRGDRLTRQGLWLILKEHARHAGLSDDITPQALRHFFAVRLLDDNTDLRAIQELLGHANIATTQIYTQLAGRGAGSSGHEEKEFLVGS